MEFSDLTPEQKERAKACETPEDMLALAQEEGYELSDEEMQNVSGGVNWGSCDNYVCANDCADHIPNNEL